MKNTFLISLAAASMISFSSFAADSEKSNAAAVQPAVKSEAKPAEVKDYVMLRFSEGEIKLSDVLKMWKEAFNGKDAPDFNAVDEKVRQSVVRGIASEKLIYKEAIKAGVDKKDEIKKRIEDMQRQIIMQSFLEEKTKSLLTDDKLKAAYDAKVAENKGVEELNARHILVAKEEEAKKIARELKKGGSFEKIAKEKSTDKASGARGGDLGWFTKDSMVPDFADAAFKLKKGEVSAPVKTAFGWHIIKLEDRRPVKLPSFEESKDFLRSDVSKKELQAYVESLLKGAGVKYFDENGKEKEFSTSLVPAEKQKSEPEKAADKPAEKTDKK